MTSRVVILGALAALVAVGGVYLLIEVRSSGASAPSEKELAEVAARHARSGSAPPASAKRAPRIEDLNAPAAGTGKLRAPSVPDIDKRLADAVNRDPGAAAGAEVEGKDPAANLDFETAMGEANKLYDRHNYEEARNLALKLLERQPGTVRMLRVVVSSSCILGDGETAQKHWNELPGFDKAQMATRCERFGVTFTP
jgi:hypothetical protein